MKIHMAGKQGDLIYALPVIKALAREHGPVHLVTSALCYQLVPLLWEQPYIADVEMDYARAYKMENGSVEPWAYFTPGEGLNLSPQPCMYRPDAPVPWTLAYAEIAGVPKLTPHDKIALPSLWNHRQWYWEHRVEIDGKPTWQPPPTCILAPESQSLKCIPLWIWHKVAARLAEDFSVIVIGEQQDGRWPPGVVDLCGLTTVGSAAKLLAEAHVAICANSLPWHLARHAGTPTFCFQDQYLERCVPVDTPASFYPAEQWEHMVEAARRFAPGHDPKTTLWRVEDLMALR